MAVESSHTTETNRLCKSEGTRVLSKNDSVWSQPQDPKSAQWICSVGYSYYVYVQINLLPRIIIYQRFIGEIKVSRWKNIIKSSVVELLVKVIFILGIRFARSRVLVLTQSVYRTCFQITLTFHWFLLESSNIRTDSPLPPLLWHSAFNFYLNACNCFIVDIFLGNSNNDCTAPVERIRLNCKINFIHIQIYKCYINLYINFNFIRRNFIALYRVV